MIIALFRFRTQRTKDSPWANAYGFYILVDKQTESRGCVNARSYLWTAWKYDLLSVIFLCIDPNDGVICYTFNPYSDDTPASWLEVGRAKGRNGHPWIILKRIYVKSTRASSLPDGVTSPETARNAVLEIFARVLK